MKKATTKMTLIVAILLNIVGVAAYYFVYSTIITKNEHISTTRNEIEYEAKRNKLDLDQKKLIETTRDERAKLDTFVLTEDGIVGFVELLERLGSETQTDVSIVSIKSDPQTGPGNLQVSISSVGEWKNVLKYLSLVESLPYKVQTTRTSVSKAGDSAKSSAPQWTLGIDMSVYKFKQP